MNFYPRPPCGGRRSSSRSSVSCVQISIHALRAEGDPHRRAARWTRTDFYPRPPCGGRPPTTSRSMSATIFLSTPSVRRATNGSARSRWNRAISIHALRAEGDRRPATALTGPLYFYPRPPCGGRHDRRWHAASRANFYPRPPCGGRHFVAHIDPQASKFLSTPSVRRATSWLTAQPENAANFYPRPPCGGRPRKSRRPTPGRYFYPRPPCGGRPFEPKEAPKKTGDFYPRPPCGGRRPHD